MVSLSELEPEGLCLGGGVPVLSAAARNWRACGELNPDLRIDNPLSYRWRTRPNWWGRGNRNLVQCLRGTCLTFQLYPRNWYSRPVTPRDLSVIGRLLSR